MNVSLDKKQTFQIIIKNYVIIPIIGNEQNRNIFKKIKMLKHCSRGFLKPKFVINRRIKLDNEF